MNNESEIQEKFDQIKAGKLSPEAFMDWVLKQQAFSYQDGYDQGYCQGFDRGYYSC